MAPILYADNLSPPARAVMLLCKELNLKVEIREVDFCRGGHMQEQFIKMNPQHTLPTLEDNGKYLWDSHAINTYIMSKYGKEEQQRRLYPRNVYQRAVIDQRLHFDNGVLFPAFRDVASALVGKNQPITEASIERAHTALGFLEQFLDGQKYSCGDEMSIADLSFSVSILALKIWLPIEEKKYPNITAWFRRMQSLPYFSEVNEEGHEKLRKLVQGKMAELSKK
ncbi:GSTE3.2 family protein [Megaselia abdita]